MTDAPKKSFPMLEELDWRHESHSYLFRYKRARSGRWNSRARSLYDLSTLQALLLSLGRRNEVIVLAIAIRPLVSDQDRLASEVLRERVLSPGAYAAHLEGNIEVAEDILSYWGQAPFGQRLRATPSQLSQEYRIIGSKEDELLQGLTEIRGESASLRLSKTCRQWLWLLTDHLILDYQLPAVEKLQQANITTSVVLDRIAIYEPVVKQLLELKRLESE
jgi:hypothetical protein